MAESQEEENFDSDAKKEQESGVNLVEPPSGLEELQKKYDELNDRFIRLAADFENYRKRVGRSTATLNNQSATRCWAPLRSASRRKRPET